MIRCFNPSRSALSTRAFCFSSRNLSIGKYQHLLFIEGIQSSKIFPFEFIPEVRKNFSGDLQLTNATTIQEAGLFEVYQEDRLVDVLAWNYDRTESQMEFCKEQELSQYFPRSKVPDIKTTCFDHNSELVKEIVLQDNNKYLTGWFILIAVSALLLEQLVWRKKLN